VQVGKFGLFADGGGAFKVKAVAVGVGERGVPHGVADEGFGDCDAAGFEFVIEGDGIFALETERNPLADSSFGDAGFQIFLKHKGGAA